MITKERERERERETRDDERRKDDESNLNCSKNTVAYQPFFRGVATLKFIFPSIYTYSNAPCKNYVDSKQKKTLLILPTPCIFIINIS